ncbi:DUF6503 family protein [Altibacter sp. HG106]|uniref:DUF6503 family protein n=1 Tax=Altibacter sp. HG106 TaxID=3023937 RepID=UPI00235081C0|nr:DUF6503 family protein [Altibacter sp. HG106]MDC7993932.1 hypothetical protein [Altibacter sp. HG106]
MKKQLQTLSLMVVATLFLSCNDTSKQTNPSEMKALEVSEVTHPSEALPALMQEVLEAHGGRANWNAMQNLCFEFRGRSGVEIHTVSLPNRLTKIEHEHWSMGYDGNSVWLLENKEDAYPGNAHFYYNLMFYFYAMPYVLADPGIVYETLPQETLAGTTYDVTKISYKAGTGVSPEDEYKLYTHPEDHTMQWLGYTVTYRSGEQSSDWHYIKYDRWKAVNGLLLPEKLTWYEVENNQPTSERNDLVFKNISITQTPLEASVFKKPEGAEIVTRN